MGYVNSLPGEFENAIFQAPSQTFSNGNVGEKIYSQIGTAPVKFYLTSSADVVVQDKYKTDLIGVVLIDPDDATFKIPEEAKIIIDSEEYSAIHAEDIAKQGVVIQIPVKRFSK